MFCVPVCHVSCCHCVKFTQTSLHPKKHTHTHNTGGSHQKRLALRRPESPTSELLFRPDAVFPSEREKKNTNTHSHTPTASSLWFPCGRSDTFCSANVAYVSGAAASSSSMACFQVLKFVSPVRKRKRCRCSLAR